MHLKPIVLFLAMLSTATGSAIANAGSIAPYPLDALAEASRVIVLGRVVKVTSDDEIDRVTVAVIDPLKGASVPDEFNLQLTPRGLVGFDIALSKGDIGVFFLSAIPAEGDDFATLAAPHGVALLERSAFRTEQ